MAENETASRRAQAAEHEKAAFALRIAGATYAQIGAQLGVTGCAAHKMVKRVLERTRGETDAEAVELRRLETERLERCPSAFAYYDPEANRVRTVSTCAWPLHKTAVMQRITAYYAGQPAPPAPPSAASPG